MANGRNGEQMFGYKTWNLTGAEGCGIYVGHINLEVLRVFKAIKCYEIIERVNAGR